MRPLYAVVILLVLACLAVVVPYFNRRQIAPVVRPTISSIAVMPVTNDSGDPSLEFLSDGLTEDLIRDLSRSAAISVKARSSVFQFKGTEIDPRKAGSDLAADAVLIGKLKRLDNRIDVEYELVDVSTGNLLLSGKTGRPERELYSIQEDIVRDVARWVSVAPAKSGTRQVPRDAYELYLRGRFFLNRRTIPDMKEALSFFRQAIEIQPDYSLAYAGLADTYVVLRDWGGLTPEDSIPPAKEAVLRALEFEPDLAEAHASLGQIFAHGPDWQAAEREYKNAIALDTSFAPAYQWYAEMLMGLGRFDEARVVIRQAIELGPLSRMFRNIQARIPLFDHHYDEAVAILKKNIELDPSWGADHDLLFHAFERKGMYPGALEAYLKSQELLRAESQAEMKLSREAFAKQGWKGFARHRLKVLEERSKKEYVRPFLIAEWCSRSGNLDKAFAYLRVALAGKSGDFTGWLKYLPVFENVRADPRYKDIVNDP